jgi:hypothetical protein
MFETSSAGPPGFLRQRNGSKKGGDGINSQTATCRKGSSDISVPGKASVCGTPGRDSQWLLHGLVPLGSSNVNFDHRSAESESCPLFVLTLPLCPPCLLCSTDVRQSSCRHLGLPCGGNRHDLFAFDLRPSRALSRSDLCASFFGHFAGACSAVRSRSIQDGQRPTKGIKFRGEAAAFFLKVSENFGYV